jgi:20S proteasome subunit alpha 5
MRFDAKAIGSGAEGAQTELQEQYHKSLTLQEATKLVLKVLKQVMEEKISSINVEVAVTTPEKGFHILPEPEVSAIIADLAA